MPADHRLRLHDPQFASPSLWPDPPHPDQKNPVSIAQARLRLTAKEHLELVSQDQVSSARSWRERQQSIKTRSSIKRKPSTGAGAYQGRARRGMDDPDRLLPPFSRSRSSSASGSWTRSLTSTRSRSSRSME